MRYFEDTANLLLHYKLYRLTESNRSVEGLKLTDFSECSYGKDVLNLLIALSTQGIISISNIRVDNKYLEIKKKIEQQKANEAVSVGSYGPKRTVTYEYFGISEELYKKISGKKSLNFADWKTLYGKAGRFADEYIAFDINVDRAKVKEYLDSYIADFIRGEVVEKSAKNNLAYANQVRAVKRTLGRLANIHGSKNISLNAGDLWTEDFKKKSAGYKLVHSQTNFVEVILSMEKTGIIRIEHFFNNYSVRVSILPHKKVSYPDNYTKDFDSVAARLFEANLWRERMEKQRKQPKEIQSPVEEEMFVEYGGIKLDGTNGRCWRDGKFIKKFYTSKAPYNVLKMLLLAKGELVTYDDFDKGIDDLPSNEKEMKSFIRRAIKGIRSSFGINMEKNPEDNIFEWTGKGFFLKIVPSKQ